MIAAAQPCEPGWDPEFVGNAANRTVCALGVYDDGEGSALYAGGYFTDVGGVAANRVARWDGAGWSPLGSGVRGTNGGIRPPDGPVLSFTVFDSGTGPELIVGGDFSYAGESEAGSIARWNGQAWTPMRLNPYPGPCSDCPAYAHVLEVMDVGQGPRLYVGGFFFSAGAWGSHVLAEHLAAWDGSVWTAVSSGLLAPGPMGVHALAPLQQTNGPVLCAGGWFSGPFQGCCFGVWDGARWSPLGGSMVVPNQPGPTPGIHAVVACDALEGPSIYIAGTLTSAAGVPVSGIARWDGQQWHSVGRGIDAEGGIYAMELFDDGHGPALYVGGRFTSAGGVPASNIAKWDGEQWSALGPGTSGDVRTLTVWDRDRAGPEAPALYIAGAFASAGGLNSPYIAKWAGCDTCYPDCDTTTGPRNLDIFDFLCFQNRFAAGALYACDCDTSSGPGVCDIFDFLCFQNAHAAGCS